MPTANRPSMKASSISIRSVSRGWSRSSTPPASLCTSTPSATAPCVRASTPLLLRAPQMERDNRHQIAHMQLVDPADFPRFEELGVVPTLTRMGQTRARDRRAARALSRAGSLPLRLSCRQPAKGRRDHHRRQRLGRLLVQSVLRLSDRRYANWQKGTKAAQYRRADSAHHGGRRLHHQRRLCHEAG